MPARRRVTFKLDCFAMPVPEMARRQITSLGYPWRHPMLWYRPFGIFKLWHIKGRRILLLVDRIFFSSQQSQSGSSSPTHSLFAKLRCNASSHRLNDHHALLFARSGRFRRRTRCSGSCSHCFRSRSRQGDLCQRQDLCWSGSRA